MVGSATARVLVEERPTAPLWTYTPGGPTLLRFHQSDSPRRLIIGPVGSGKSTACCMEIFSRAQEQEPDPDGIRRTCWLVARNTYRELKDTTVRTWLEWFREDIFGQFSWSDMEHRIRVGDVDMEVKFRSLDGEGDVRKVLSLNLTGAWFNEAREFPLGIIVATGDRIKRYPTNPTWCGMIMDTNPPDEDHWIYRFAEEDRPEGWEIFKQPGGLIEIGGKFYPNPLAENVRDPRTGKPGVPRDYYPGAIGSGASPDHLRVYHCAQYGFVRSGRPVYPDYVDAVHCAHQELEPVRGLPLYVGLDFGLTPAATLGQRLPDGRWQTIDELVAQDMGIQRFAEPLGQMLRGRYAGMTVEVIGDPAGSIRAQTDETTVYQMLKACGIDARPAPSNDVELRVECVASSFRRMVDGKPGHIISPRCKVLRKGLAGGYGLRRLRVSGEDRYADKPDKGPYSHVCDAQQYMMLGAGEGRALVETPNSKPVRIVRQSRPMPRI